MRRAISWASCCPCCWTLDLAGGALWMVAAGCSLAGRDNCVPHLVCNIPVNTHSALQECPDSCSGYNLCHFPDHSLQDCCLATHSGICALRFFQCSEVTTFYMCLYWISLYWCGGVSCFIPSVLLWILYVMFSKTRAAGMFVGLGRGVNSCGKVLCPSGSRNTAPFCGWFWQLEESSVTEDPWAKGSIPENLCFQCIWSGLFYQAPSRHLILQCWVQGTVVFHT